MVATVLRKVPPSDYTRRVDKEKNDDRRSGFRGLYPREGREGLIEGKSLTTCNNITFKKYYGIRESKVAIIKKPCRSLYISTGSLLQV